MRLNGQGNPDLKSMRENAGKRNGSLMGFDNLYNQFQAQSMLRLFIAVLSAGDVIPLIQAIPTPSSATVQRQYPLSSPTESVILHPCGLWVMLLRIRLSSIRCRSPVSPKR